MIRVARRAEREKEREKNERRKTIDRERESGGVGAQGLLLAIYGPV